MTTQLNRLIGEGAAHPSATKETGRDRGDGATRKSLLQQIHADYPGNAGATQCARILAAMQLLGSVTTTEARLYLEIMNPSQRVTDLRRQGHEVVTTWAVEPSEAGQAPHRQARYIMKPLDVTAGFFRADLAGWLVLAAVSAALLIGGAQ